MLSANRTHNQIIKLIIKCEGEKKTKYEINDLQNKYLQALKMMQENEAKSSKTNSDLPTKIPNGREK